MMKGVGTTVASIIIVLILIFFLAIYLNTINNELNKRVVINLKETEILKLGNTFVLTTRSIGMTWFISSAQAMFNASDNAFLCGIDDKEQDRANDDLLADNYVYSYDGKSFKDVKGAIAFADKADAAATLTDARQNKYSRDWPRICYETDIDAKQTLSDQFVPYTDIKRSFEANGIKVKIEDISNEFGFNYPYGVWSTTRQKLNLVSSSGLAKIDTQTENVNQFYTAFPAMAEAMRKTVRYLAYFSDRMFTTSNEQPAIASPELRYQPLKNGPDNTVPDTFDSYVERIKSTMLDEIVPVYATSAPLPFFSRPTLPFQGTTNIEFNKVRIFAANAEDAQIFGKDSAASTNGFGLALYYDATIRLTDGSSIVGKKGKQQVPEYKKIIEAAVADKTWEFSETGFGEIFANRVKYTNEEVVSFVSAIIMQESMWEPAAVSNCGAAGLNQFMPKTARGYFNSPVNIFENADFDDCRENGRIKQERLAYSTRLKARIEGLDNEAIKPVDDRFDPAKSIPAAVKLVHELFTQMDEHTASKEELLRLVAAAYNTGPGDDTRGVRGAINRALRAGTISSMADVKFVLIKNFLSSETQNYVESVIGYYVFYGGAITGGNFYYYHDIESNTFSPRPFTVEMRVQEYLPILNCINETAFPIRAADLAFTTTGSKVDMVCCGGSLWSCNANIQDLPFEQSLSTGQIANRPSGTKAQENCDDSLNPIDPARRGQIPITPKDLACTDVLGFIAVPRGTVGGTVVSCGPNQYKVDNSCFECPDASSCSDLSGNYDACIQCLSRSCEASFNKDEYPVCEPKT